MLTYKITGYNGLPHEEYTLRLQALGFLPSVKEKVDLHIYAFNGKGEKDWQTQSRLKSCVDGIGNVANKSRLYKTLGETARKYMAEEYSLGEVLRTGRVNVPGPLLLKPVGSMAFAGNGIQMVVQNDRPSLERKWKYVACEYVKDILTFSPPLENSKSELPGPGLYTGPALPGPPESNCLKADPSLHSKELHMGYKFHLRVYLFVSTWGRWQLYPKYRIIPAKLPYRKGDWQNKDIHDTHFDAEGKDYFFCPQGDFYLAETDRHIQLVCAELAGKIQATAFPESEAAYEMLGLDFLVRDNGLPVLLEVNNNAGVSVAERWNWFKEEIMEIELSFIKEYFQL